VDAKPNVPHKKPDSYRRAFDELDAGRVEAAFAYARGSDPVLNKVLRAYYMAQPGNSVDFTELSSFINQNPDWPGLKGITAIAEQKIPQNASSEQVINWFSAHPPVSNAGFYRYADALEAAGQNQDVVRLVSSRWIDGEFGIEDMGTFRSRFARYLSEDADRARLDRLLWKNDSVNARRMFTYVSEDVKVLASARLALANQNPNAESFVARVPRALQSDPGLAYEMLRYYVRGNNDDAAVSILQNTPVDLGKADAWWEPRQTEIRRAMLRHDYRLAYQLAAYHGQSDGKTLTQGEFLAGFLALRCLNDPARAREHFQALFDTSTTPVSRARGAYWLGRTYEALNNKPEAEQAYETAAALNITFYGQLATTRLYANPVLRALPEPKIPNTIRQAFFNRDVVRAIERLYRIGEDDRARTFFKAATNAADARAEFALLTELAYQLNRPDMAIEAAKAANQKNMLMASGGFPVLDRALSGIPEPAFIHALIRQESMFNPDAKSPVGAHGLMQLMPRTAEEVARKLGIKFHSSLLGNPSYNLRLGTTFIQNQLAIFDGSYVLALAGYNAGPRRVGEWMAQIGDPRDTNTDPIDWIEMIPVNETRNYVQRILESLQVYRARLNGGEAPLLIIKDLRR
jgi:soluble lytic murein transglycosylase